MIRGKTTKTNMIMMMMMMMMTMMMTMIKILFVVMIAFATRKTTTMKTIILIAKLTEPPMLKRKEHQLPLPCHVTRSKSSQYHQC